MNFQTLEQQYPTVTFGQGVSVEQYVKIGKDCTIGNRVFISVNTNIGELVVIGASSVIEMGTTIGNRSTLQTSCHVDQSSTIGEDRMNILTTRVFNFKGDRVYKATVYKCDDGIVVNYKDADLLLEDFTAAHGEDRELTKLSKWLLAEV